MHDDVKFRRAKRKSRRPISFLVFGVLLLAAWVLVTNTIFAPRDTAEPQASGSSTVASVKTDADDLDTRSVTVPKVDPVERAAPAAEETATAEEKSVPELTDPVEVAAVASSMGGTETLLSPTLVSRSIKSAPESPNGLAPPPPTRPRVAAIPLPRPRPASAEPRFSGQAISDSEIFRQQTY